MKLISKVQNIIDIDASKYTYGRLCARIAGILLGKENPFYCKNKLTGRVRIINIDKIMFTGKNKIKNIYHYKHSGYSKGLKKITLEDMIKKGRFIDYLRISVYKMMPKTHNNKKYIYRNVKNI